MSYAEWVFELSTTDQSGITKRAHLEQVYKSTKKMPDDLKPREIPQPLLYIWQTFVSISACRQSGFSGPLAISYTEIKSWSELTGNDLTPLDVDILRKLDALYLKVING